MTWIIALVAAFFLGLLIGKSWGRQEYHDFLVKEQNKKNQLAELQDYLKGGK